MSNETEIIRSIWMGREFISIGETKIKGEEFHFKKQGMPLFNKFVPIMANATKVPYQERKLWFPYMGDSGITMRIYFADLKLNKYYAMANPQDMVLIQHLKHENEALKQEIERLFGILHDLPSEDRLTKRIKREMDNWQSIKGGWGGNNYGSFGGGSSGYNHFSSGIGGGASPDENNY